MSTSKSVDKRPLSPFMIGPYYRPQLTSMLSILHRATGVFLIGGLALTIQGLFGSGAATSRPSSPKFHMW